MKQSKTAISVSGQQGPALLTDKTAISAISDSSKWNSLLNYHRNLRGAFVDPSTAVAMSHNGDTKKQSDTDQ